MKEDYLHAIWRLKRFPVSNLFLTDGRSLKIKNTGNHNLDAGPDFFNGSVEIDEITWHGNIEIHVKSSDWYLHKHQVDKAYSNVILHVVFQHDKDVFIGKHKIPTLELKPHIDIQHLENYDKLLQNKTWIPCQNSLQEINQTVISKQIEKASYARLKRKSKLLNHTFENLNSDLLALYFEIYAKVFGLKVNTIPFIELTKHIDLKTFWKVNEKQREILILGVAGFFQDEVRFQLLSEKVEWSYLKKKFSLTEMDLSSWKFKGLRPPSFPNLKLTQFAELCSQKDFFKIHELNLNEILALQKKLHFSHNFRDNILINAIIPIMWFHFERSSDEKYKVLALELLSLTQVENNQIINKWKNLGIKCKSSFESQGLLELKNELCAKSKCLSCKIGLEILKK
ncbi:MAG: DUF2851 family protein [Bacteroidota bacterium]